MAVLLLHANKAVSNDQLIDELWGETPPETARSALRVHVAQLRKVLGEGRIETRADQGARSQEKLKAWLISSART